VFVLNRSSSIRGASESGTDWSCGPQLALVNGLMIDGLRGNWTKDSVIELFLLENWIPRSDVTLRYRIVYLTESIWPGEQLLLYWEMMLVMVARSRCQVGGQYQGRSQVDGHSNREWVSMQWLGYRVVHE